MNLPRYRIPQWRFWLPLILQTGLIMAVPARAFYTYVSGETVVLQTVPVDPYDLLRGYSQTLRYDISNLDRFKNLPGWEELNATRSNGRPFYVILEAPKSANTKPPLAWQPVAVSSNLPDNLPDNRIPLEGTIYYNSVRYGLETYYMPEDRRNKINAEINNLNFQNRRPFVVEVKIDSQGKAVPISLWIEDRNYRF
ncbi:MAG: GDYXXLXY domain-containing protein [Prochloraceae cyanobacterium]|nr:GDYXXLXY domain-containing protein [Prochloraceae cyanobacterium]